MGEVDVIDPSSKKPLCINGICTNAQSRNNVLPATKKL
jgi:hypothetical protein